MTTPGIGPRPSGFQQRYPALVSWWQRLRGTAPATPDAFLLIEAHLAASPDLFVERNCVLALLTNQGIDPAESCGPLSRIYARALDDAVPRLRRQPLEAHRLARLRESLLLTPEQTRRQEYGLFQSYYRDAVRQAIDGGSVPAADTEYLNALAEALGWHEEERASLYREAAAAVLQREFNGAVLAGETLAETAARFRQVAGRFGIDAPTEPSPSVIDRIRLLDQIGRGHLPEFPATLRSNLYEAVHAWMFVGRCELRSRWFRSKPDRSTAFAAVTRQLEHRQFRAMVHGTQALDEGSLFLGGARLVYERHHSSWNLSIPFTSVVNTHAGADFLLIETTGRRDHVFQTLASDLELFVACLNTARKGMVIHPKSAKSGVARACDS